MNVRDILYKISKLSLNEDNPDLMLEDRILSYINMTYLDIYSEIASINQDYFVQCEEIIIDKGQGKLKQPILSILKIIDKYTNHELIYKELVNLPELDIMVNNKSLYYRTDNYNLISIYPKNVTKLKIFYIPTSNILKLDSLESEIKIPIQFHNILIWGALLYLTFDERDKLFANENLIIHKNYENLKSRLVNFLHNKKSYIRR